MDIICTFDSLVAPQFLADLGFLRIPYHPVKRKDCGVHVSKTRVQRKWEQSNSFFSFPRSRGVSKWLYTVAVSSRITCTWLKVHNMHILCTNEKGTGGAHTCAKAAQQHHLVVCTWNYNKRSHLVPLHIAWMNPLVVYNWNYNSQKWEKEDTFDVYTIHTFPF